jgi:aminoglycoside phosphotransferase (APT) family kinase protein
VVQQHDAAESGSSAAAARPSSSRRDPEATRQALQVWLATTLDQGAEPEVLEVHVPEANGMSSETVLLDARWTEAGQRVDRALVARIAPEDTSVPVFPRYDLEAQFRTMQLVGELTTVPVPGVHWLELDAGHIGSPFFVMSRAHGLVPPDVMPYDFGDNWLYDASPEDQRRLQDATIEVLAQLHGTDGVEDRFSFLRATAPDGTPTPGDTPLRRHVEAQRAYYGWVSSDGRPSPLIEACFDWLDEHWPEDEGPVVLSWGDSRIGNVMYQDFEPAAVLDWEMAGLAAREVDLAWLIVIHRFFEEIATQMGLPGMPHFLRRDDVTSTYESLTGHTPRDMDFHTMYAALRHGIVMSQVQRRAIHFGEGVMPDDVDDLIMHRAMLEAMLAGTYWDGVPTG